VRAQQHRAARYVTQSMSESDLADLADADFKRTMAVWILNRVDSPNQLDPQASG
jgi:hypothetical protein